MPEDNQSSFAQRIRGFRKKLERKQKQTRAKRRAKSRRIEKEQPKNLSEKAVVKKKQAEKAVGETREELSKTATESKKFLATELGVETNEVEGLASQLNDMTQQFSGQLDLDDDGDTDLLQVVDVPMQDEGDEFGGEDLDIVDPVNAGGNEVDLTEPVGDSPADPLFNDEL